MKRLIPLLLTFLVGCTQTPIEQKVTLWERTEAKAPNIQYLGVGGWLLEWHGEALLFPPSFTNPPIYKLPFNTTPNTTVIDQMMPDASRVTMILVGHGHYDHLLDLASIAKKQASHATIYGSQSVAHVLSAELPKRRLVVVNKKISPTSTEEGKWIPSQRGYIRAMPIRSKHAPHFLGFHLVTDRSYKKDLKRLPRSAWTWKGGESISWLVDLLDDNQKPVFRIHYQDSAATPPYGFPPILRDGKAIDLQILCAGSWEQVKNYPVKLLQVTRPKLITIGHWENFIGGDLRNPTIIPFLNLKGLVDRVQSTVPETPVLVPAPFSRIELEISAP